MSAFSLSGRLSQKGGTREGYQIFEDTNAERLITIPLLEAGESERLVADPGKGISMRRYFET